MLDDKLKLTSVPDAVSVASLMHQRYAEFRGCFLLGLLSTLQWCSDTIGLGSGRREDEKARAAAASGRSKPSSGKQKSGERIQFGSLSEAVADAKSRVVMEAEADDDDFGGMSATKARTAAAVASTGSGGDAPSPEDVRNAGARCRVLLRLVWEVYRAGIYEDSDAVPVRAAL